jgi:cytochrome P450
LQTDPFSVQQSILEIERSSDIAGYEVAKGASVNLDVVSIHHDAAVFSDPEKFDPDRFDASLAPPSFS